MGKPRCRLDKIIINNNTNKQKNMKVLAGKRTQRRWTTCFDMQIKASHGGASMQSLKFTGIKRVYFESLQFSLSPDVIVVEKFGLKVHEI